MVIFYIGYSPFHLPIDSRNYLSLLRAIMPWNYEVVLLS